MTLNDLSKIYNGNIMLTVNAYFENRNDMIENTK